MEVLGYIVQVFDEDKLMPETGYKHLYKTFQHSLDYARSRVNEYTSNYPNGLVDPFELHTPSKKETDSNGYSIVFRNAEMQIWIEVIVV